MDHLSISNDFEQWLRFVMSQTHVLREYPELLLQQGLNQPAQSSISEQAGHWLTRNPRPWLKWTSGPKEESPCLLVLLGHSATVNTVAITPDCQRIVSGGEDKTIRIWDIVSGEEIQTLTGHSAGVTALLVAADGNRIFSGSVDWTIKVWDAQSGLEENALIAHKGKISSLQQSADGRYLVSTSLDDGTTRVWEIPSGKIITGSESDRILQATTNPSTRNGHEVLAADGKFLIVGAGKDLVVKHAAESREICSFSGHAGVINCVAISSNGLFIVTGGWDHALSVWDARSVLRIAQAGGSDRASEPKAHRTKVKDIALRSDALRAVSLAEEIIVWNVAEPLTIKTLQPQDHCHGMALTPDGRYILALGNSLQVFDAESAAQTPQAESPHEIWVQIWDTAVTADGEHLITVGNDSSLRFWTIPNVKLLRTTEVDHGPISLVKSTADGRFVVSAGGPSTFYGLPVVSSRGVADQMSGSEDKNLKVFDQKGKLLFCLDGHNDRVLAAALTPDGRVISGSRDQTIKIWDLNTRKQVTTLTGHHGAVNHIMISADSRFFVSESEDSVRIWDAQSYKPLLSLKHAVGNSLRCVSSDSRYVVTTKANILNIWNSETGEVSQRFPTQDTIEAVQTLDDLLVAGDALGTIYFLNLRGSLVGPRIVTAHAISKGRQATCPYCRKVLNLAESTVGQQFNCAFCSKALQLSAFVVTPSHKPAWRFW